MSETPVTYLPAVRAQYEAYPYPPRDPEREREALGVTSMDGLAKINHHCFSGGRDLRADFRPLVAGGGTGDAAILLAEQLRGTGIEVIYLDLSAASMAVAKTRAQVRGLDNIRWIHGSILDLPQLALGEFDYISCSGVLMALEDPSAGLRALESVLAPGGAMGIMVYAQYGRAGVYPMQALMRQINRDADTLAAEVENAKAVLACLPATNWLKRSEDLVHDHLHYGDSGIYDLLLHSQDRAYTVPELYEWVEGSGLRIIDFVDKAHLYRPEIVLKDFRVLDLLLARSLRERQAAAEIINGSIIKHVFYCAREPVAPPALECLDNVPRFSDQLDSQVLVEAVRSRSVGDIVNVTLGSVAINISIREHTVAVLECIDDVRPMGKSFDEIRSTGTGDRGDEGGPSNEVLLEELRRLWEPLALMDLVYLRHRSVAPYQRYLDMVRTLAARHSDPLATPCSPVAHRSRGVG